VADKRTPLMMLERELHEVHSMICDESMNQFVLLVFFGGKNQEYLKAHLS
jgi:hypothetical protein